MSILERHQKFKEFIQEDGEFWADKVKRLKNEGRTDDVLDICRRKLPLPAAFKEAAIGLRKRIRETKKREEQFDGYLQELYELAVYEEFLFSEPTVKINIGSKQEEYPSYNVAEIAHEAGARQKLNISYEDLGYEAFGLLTKTDRLLLSETWGEPRQHRSARKTCINFWNQYLAQYEAERKEKKADFRRSLEAILESKK